MRRVAWNVANVAVAIAAAVALTASAAAQWPAYVGPDVPRGADGRPDLNAPPPRLPNGKPDLSGVWESRVPPSGRLGGAMLPSLEPDAPPLAAFVDIGTNMSGGLPLTPWAADLKKQRMAIHSEDNPDAHCLPLGFMQLHTHSQPRKVVQTNDVLVIMYEANYGLRQIFTNGRSQPAGDPQPWWYGYSVGHWDGDTLVVETTGLRGAGDSPHDGWLDVNGSPFTSAARITERFRRVNYGRLEIDVTVDDPKAYTRAWTVRINDRLIPGDELIEFICNENERSTGHFVK